MQTAPLADVAVNAYVVVLSGRTVRVPLGGTVPSPEMKRLAAPEEPHDTVELCPADITAGHAEMKHEGRCSAVTVTDVSQLN